jgi:hypothetical protein
MANSRTVNKAWSMITEKCSALLESELFYVPCELLANVRGKLINCLAHAVVA